MQQHQQLTVSAEGLLCSLQAWGTEIHFTFGRDKAASSCSIWWSVWLWLDPAVFLQALT